MTPLQDHAIVLRLTEFSETSQIATVFSAERGSLRLIAKGARRSTKTKFAAGLDLLEYGELGFLPARGDAQLGILTDWRQRDTFAGLRRELLRLYGGMYAAELVAGLTEEADPHPLLFNGLLRLLQGLGGTESAVPLIAWFQSVLLREIGYAPLLEHCVECGRVPPPGAPVFFSAAAGGLLCRDCEMHHTEKRRLSARLLTPGTHEHAVDGPGVTATSAPALHAGEHGPEHFAHDPAGWFELFDYHLTYVAGRRFRAAPTLASLLAGTPTGRL